MMWPTGDAELRAYVEEQQRIALRTYEVNPDLLEEHVRQEDSFRSGGYGQRQVSELLQNAVDALTHARVQGRIEFRLADGALYCANEGAPFDRGGVRTVSYAFLSTKREDQIGRFGLGFKSILGVTDRPQIFSRSVSFEFNAPETAALFGGASSESGNLPLLRVPSLIDLEAEIATDRNLQELMTWASTVVKLPLERDGQRIRREISDFDTKSLLFMKSVDRLVITLQDDTGALTAREHRREGDLASGEVLLLAPGKEPARWLFAERESQTSEEMLKALTATTGRKSMTVSYAVPLDKSPDLGEFWAWFPLRDRTTARGIFNAPWQVNDDRTSMLENSPLNGVLLDVCAELFLDVVARASTPEDPAAHLDLFPARGKEIRSPADKVLSERIPRLARTRRMIPDALGILQVPGYFAGVPELDEPTVPALQMEAWQSVASRTTIPHWKCFTTNTRTTRLRTLIRTDDASKSASEVAASTWLTELAQLRTPEAVVTSLGIYQKLRSQSFGDALGDAPIIPTENGEWARARSTDTVLLPVSGMPSPAGLTLVDEEFGFDEEIRVILKSAGFREVSADQTAAALAATARGSWDSEEWERLWRALGRASTSAAIAALRTVRERELEVMVKTRVGTWRRATDVFADNGFASSLDDRHVDDGVHSRRSDLLEAAGCLVEPAGDFKLWQEPLFAEYAASTIQALTERLREAGHSVRGIVIPDVTGSGPLQVLEELQGDDAALAAWTTKLLRSMQAYNTNISVPLANKQIATVPVFTPEWWAAQRFGCVQTSLGFSRVPATVGAALREYAEFLPVAPEDASTLLNASTSLQTLPDSALQAFLARDGYSVRKITQLTEILVECARREVFSDTARIPGMSGGVAVSQLRSDVVLAMSDDDIALLEEHGATYVDGTVDGAETLITRWGLRTSEEALSRSLEIREEGREIPLLDKFPSLGNRSREPLGRVRLRTSPGILRKTVSPTGLLETRLMSARMDDVIIVDDSLDDHQILVEISSQLSLGLSVTDISATLREDEALRRNTLVEKARTATTDPERLLLLVGAAALRSNLPKGLLPAIEDKRGPQSDHEVAELYWRIRGFESVWRLRENLREIGLNVPRDWTGSAEVQAFVFSLGFSTSYAGVKEVKKPAVSQVQGQIELNRLHDFQEVLADKVRDLALVRRPNGDAQRGLLFLPTGAGKTRVTVEAVVRMLLNDELSGPILWIAQSQELCEQAIQTWTDVWRAIGDKRVIDVCRFWTGYELDESNEELQIVVAVDDMLRSRIESSDARHYNWLSNASLVIIDEAHTALSPTYTGILRWLGLTSAKTTRPLLGLTATPYRGRNAETNNRFVERFGRNKLESLDPDDPIGQLRRERVLAEVDYDVLDGMRFTATGAEMSEFNRIKDITKTMLDRIGQDLDRNQTVVNDVLRQDSTWPILIFAASVASAHTIAALLRLEGREAAAVDGSMRGQERRRVIDQFRSGELQVLVNCDLLTQGFDAPKVRALYVARPTFSPNRYHQMIGRGLRGPENGGKERCLIVNINDTFDQFGEQLAFTEFDYLWETK